MKETRINKFLSEAGYCSRRAADKLLEAGRITINGETPLMGTKIVEGDDVRVDGQKITRQKDDFVYIAFNKPIGIVCTTDTRVEKNNIIGDESYLSNKTTLGLSTKHIVDMLYTFGASCLLDKSFLLFTILA